MTNGKGRTQDPFALARWLLQDGEVVVRTRDGVVAELPDECFAHVGADGSVDMMAPQAGQTRSFAKRLQNLAQRPVEEGLTRIVVFTTD